MQRDTVEALTVVADRAAAAGWRLETRFQIDPFPRHGDVAKRVGALRVLYNSESRVRDAVDRTVSTIGSRGPSIRGGPETVRAFLQQQTGLLGVRQFMNQAVRDAEVCGNGYLEMRTVALDAYARCVKPERVTLRVDGGFEVMDLAGDTSAILPKDRLVHFPGVAQFRARYGISTLEPFLYVLSRRRVAAHVRASAAAMPANASDATKADVASLLAVIATIETQTESQLSTLLAFFPRSLPEPSGDLYFPGQEQMR
jgi:hypothetical protein